MKKQSLVKLMILVVLLCFGSSMFAGTANTASTEQLKEQMLIKIMLHTLNQWHYEPLKLDDHFSAKSFELYLKNLDYNKKFFLNSDVEHLKTYQYKIDDQLKSGSTVLMDQANDILFTRIREIRKYSQDILGSPIDLTRDELFQSNPDKLDFPKNKTEQKELWRQLLKYQMLLTYLELEKTASKSVKVKFDGKLELQARKKVLQSINATLERMLRENREEQFERYLDAVGGAFDPHTDYFPPIREQEFNIDMSGKLEGIGALLREEGEYIKVEQIIPGSAAWRQKGLQEGDTIIKVAEGNSEPVDISYMRINDVVKLIRGKKGTEVRLTVKKPNGDLEVIPIIRDIVVIEETYAKSAIIKHEKTGRNFGYIFLPSFYNDFKGGRNSANDVKLELEKLNQAKISGLILDLRNNTGGALDDAVKISGLFIPDGPMVQIRNQVNQIEKLIDPDSKVYYKGPLVVLINTFSASASEIVAAALQDYGRAIIVGSPSTFGKGTVQVLAELERFLPKEYSSLKPLGSLKLTIQKFYRVNGGSTQFKGVAADIVLPDTSSYLKVGERNLAHPLSWDTVKAATYEKSSSHYNLRELKLKSAARLEKSPAFQLISEAITQIELEQENTIRHLQLAKFKQVQADSKKYDKLAEVVSDLKVSIPKANKKKQASSASSKEFIQQVRQDSYIGEVVNILEDAL